MTAAVNGMVPAVTAVMSVTAAVNGMVPAVTAVM